MMMRRKVFFVALTFVSAVSLLAAAQTKKPAAKPAAAAPAKKTPSKAAAEDAGAPTKEAAETTPPREGAKNNAGDSKSPDGGRVFRFGEVEVEGRLKSPQIVYFLRRVRAEFAAGDLGHRSFMSELGETKYEPAF